MPNEVKHHTEKHTIWLSFCSLTVSSSGNGNSDCSPGLGGWRKRDGCVYVESYGILSIHNTSVVDHLNNLNF